MAVHLHPELLCITYDRLRFTAPFRRWKLPPGEQISFHVTNHDDRYGHFTECKRWKFIRIGASRKNVKTLAMLDYVISHEMVHLRLHLIKCKEKDDHGKHFKKLAAQVCRVHRFPKDHF